ncbi:MAG: putative sulfate exporter family transporter [Deltaproteobacteria bacterium]|nr:putative sulfate exporter family transporter [Deltaproteobacteria bacterium]
MVRKLGTEGKRMAIGAGLIARGLLLATGVAAAARLVHHLLPVTAGKMVSDILIAILLGLFIRNVIGLSPGYDAGVKFAVVRVLRLGIVLLGLRLSLQDIAATGGAAMLLVVVCITIALVTAYAVGRLFQIPPRLAALIGVGTSICGNTAIVATAPAIGAKEEEVSFAVAVITLFGLIAVVTYPIIGQALGFSNTAFGLWAGTAVNDTSQVVAVGAAHSSEALGVATVVKLMRNTIMAPLIIVMGLFLRQRGSSDPASPRSVVPRGGILIPWFVIGFLTLSLVRTSGISAGILPRDVGRPGDLQTAASVLNAFDVLARFAILTALAGVGLGTRLQSIFRIGLRPFVLGLCVSMVLAAASLGLIVVFSMG